MTKDTDAILLAEILETVITSLERPDSRAIHLVKARRLLRQFNDANS